MNGALHSFPLSLACVAGAKRGGGGGEGEREKGRERLL